MPTRLLIRYASPARATRILVARGGLDRLGRLVSRWTGASRVVLVSDRRVASLYGRRALASLRRASLRPALVTVAPGERAKRPAEAAALWERFARLDLTRRDAVVALGGGVVGDLAGFAAAAWLRGVPWVGVPTTLLAQVDSSVGGKTGLDLSAGKNLVGAFHQPAGVLVDPGTLATLPARQRRAGLAEVVKAGAAVDGALFSWLERHADALAAGEPRALEGAIVRALRAKARVVRHDERERGGATAGRAALNFGHTLGHAIEAARGYRGPLHGEAVAVGMRVAARLSSALAGLDERSRRRIESLLDRLALPRRMPSTSLRALLAAMALDKKRDARGVRWVLTPRIGHASVPRLVPSRLTRTALIEAGARP